MKRLAVLLLLSVVCTAGSLRAQDAQYWDNQYGTKGNLLGGLVVGSPSDLSATYYNPGWIALGVDASLLVTTQAVEYSSIDIRGALGESTNPNQTTFRSSPGFLAGRFNVMRVEGWQLAWSYFEKIKYRYDVSGVRIDPDPVPPPPGETWLAGESFRHTRTDENWYGFTLARKIGRRVAFGATPYVVYRTQEQRIQNRVDSWNSAGEFSDLYVMEEFTFNHYRLLAKFGFAFDYEPVKFGFALTTPGLGLFGSGRVNAYSSYHSIALDPPDYLAANAQEDLAAHWSSPLSIAGGLSWRSSGGSGVHATAEWFSPVNQDGAVQPEPFTAQSDGSLQQWQLGLDQKAVLNFGLAVDHRFSPRFALYAAGRSDWSSIAKDPGSDLLMSTWDLWHISGGASFQFLGIEFTAGLQYSFGNGTTDRSIDLVDSGEAALDFPRTTADVRYRRLKLVIGFDLALLGGKKEDPLVEDPN